MVHWCNINEYTVTGSALIVLFCWMKREKLWKFWLMKRETENSTMILSPRNGWTRWLSTNISILQSYQMTYIAEHHARGAAAVSVSDIYLSLIYSFFFIFHFQNFINKISKHKETLINSWHFKMSGSNGAREKALRFLREVPRLHFTNIKVIWRE